MRIWSRFIEFAGAVVPVLLLGVVLVVVSADVIGRTVFDAPVYAAHEIAILAFVWLVWLGGVGAASRGELIGVAYFVDLCPPRARAWIRAAIDALTVLIALATMGAAAVQISRARFTSYELLGVPKWVAALGLLVGMGLVAIVYAFRAAAHLSSHGSRPP